jgi:RNA polymerase sigma factor (TIGR02999 family)
MDMPSGDVTALLAAWRGGDRAALDALTPVVHQELHRLARRHMNRERPGHTLQTTALVNEAYLRLVDERRIVWKDRAHFFAVAAQLMRFILVDHARARQRAKRGGDVPRISVHDDVAGDDPAFAMIPVDQALGKLAQLSPRQARIAELRLFAGLGLEELAEVLAVSVATVTRDWRLARAWLQRELG